MNNDDKKGFAQLLADVMDGYGKPLPDVATWFKRLAPFTPANIEAAFASYIAERPDFAPVPNSIVARCRLMDGRPDDNEAWALSLASMDERETVVWTAEMATAFGICQGVLSGGDEVGARMAFKDAYNRMVAAARAQNLPAIWSVSSGWDGQLRAAALAKAVGTGLLGAPQAALLLPNGVVGTEPSDFRPEGLQRVLEALGTLEDPRAKADRISQARMDEEEKTSREIAARVDRYTAQRRSGK